MKKIKSIKTQFSNKFGKNKDFINSIIIYNESGSITEESHFSGPDEIESRVEYKYNDQGKVVEETNYMENNEFTEKVRYTRNDEGVAVKIEIDYSDGSKSVKIIERNDNSEIVTTYDEENQIEAKINAPIARRVYRLSSYWSYARELSSSLRPWC